jgi:CubicO group peptidase (beta-lactamase class C family)
MIKNSLLLILLLFTSAAFADDNIDSFVTAEMQKEKIPGLALLIVKDGQIVKAKGYGYANLEHQVPVKPETIFQSGSMGKQFTATAVMLLVEEGKINLDDPIGKYLKNAPSSWEKITVRNLLTHTSGLGDYPEGFDFQKDWTEEELYEMLKKQPISFQPGEKYDYSNLGYMLLGILIHEVSGQFYGDFLQERVFQPLGMTTTRITNEADIIPNRAAGYHLVNGEIKNQEWVSPTLSTADGALYFTILDLAKWDAALYTEKILKKSSLDQMWTPVKLNNGSTYPYGFGWDVTEIRGHRVIEHSGTWQGFRGFIARYVDDRLTVVVLMNLYDAHRRYIAHTIAGLYYPAVTPTKTESQDEEE